MSDQSVNGPAFSIIDPESSGAVLLEAASLQRWAAFPAQDECENQLMTTIAAHGELSIEVKDPTLAASEQVDEPEAPPCPEPQDDDGLRFSGLANSHETDAKTARQQAPRPFQKCAKKAELPAGVSPDQAAAEVWPQAAVLSKTAVQRPFAPVTPDQRQLIGNPQIRLLSDTPKAQAPHSQNTRSPAVLDAKSDEVETAVAITQDISSTPAAVLRHEPPQAFQRGGKETLARPAPHEPISGSAVTAAPSGANMFETAGSTQSVLKLVETVIKGGEVPAPALPPRDGPRIRVQNGQAGSLKFKLHPTELGEVQVTMRVSNERVFIDVRVENAEAYDALARDGDEITAKLAGLGLHINQVAIHNSQTGSGSAGHKSNESGDAPRHESGHSFDPRDAPKDQGKRTYDENASFETGHRKMNSPALIRLDELAAERKSIYI
jgi:flagellar hook-length control protein FliK